MHLTRVLRFAIALLMPVASVALAQYPVRPIHIVQPYAVGGSNDAITRIVAQKIAENTGKTVIVENRTGAGGRIGYEFAARATPDGYTVVANDPAQTMLPALYGNKLSWDPNKDLVPVTNLAEWPFILVVSPRLHVTTLAQLIQLAQANPGKLNYGSSGNGALVHIATELFQREAHVQLTHVPYKGMGDAVTGMLTGSVDLMIIGTAPVVAHIRAGRIVPIVMASTKRSPALPDVPSSTEAGLPGFIAGSWVGLAAPKGTPQEAIEWLHAEAKKALSSADVRERLSAQGVEPSGISPADFATQMREEAQRWSAVINAANIRPD